jgi:hypothetical protein
MAQVLPRIRIPWLLACALALLSAPAIRGQESRPAEARRAPTTQPASAPTTQPGLAITTAGETVRVTNDGRPVLVYRFRGAAKPYIQELYTPGGVQILLDSPPDHVHHRGVMFGVAVNGVDFWAEGEENGREVDRGVRIGTAPQNSPLECVQLVQGIDWQTPGDETLLRESRDIRVHKDPKLTEAGVVLLTWRTVLSVQAPATEATLSGVHYFGLGLRFVRAMDKDGRFIPWDDSRGEVVRGDETLYTGRWCAYTASIDGKPVTVALFDYPTYNPRPATWFTMKDPFAFLGATFKLHKEPLKITNPPAVLPTGGAALELRYGIAVWDGAVTPDRIRKMSYLWVELTSPPPH